MVSIDSLIREAVQLALKDKQAEMTDDLLDKIVDEVSFALRHCIKLPEAQ